MYNEYLKKKFIILLFKNIKKFQKKLHKNYYFQYYKKFENFSQNSLGCYWYKKNFKCVSQDDSSHFKINMSWIIHKTICH